MADPPFDDLREALLRRGVAPRHARRAVLELDAHFHQLMQERLERGDSEDAARIAARELLGADEVLISRFADLHELRAWSNRWPALWFTLVPLLSFIAVFVAAIAILCLSGELMSSYLQHVQVPPHVSSSIDRLAQGFFLWVLPVSIGTVFALLAYRQRVALHWPVAGIAIVSGLVSLINVNVVLTGGASPGSVGAGIGISTHSLPRQMTHAVAILLPVVAPLWIAWRRHGCDGRTVD